ncbi:glycosyltransferase family 2 protein (plasmid) [Haloferacaceae archaeon DSL9]
MYKDNTIAVVIPAYNEAGFVGRVIETIPAFVDRIYVIDDCSTDETWDEITAVADRLEPATLTSNGETAFDRRVVPIRHETNRGVGGAIKTGYLRARKDRVDVTAVMGGDGQMDPTVFERIIDPIAEGRADYVKGNRLLFDDHHAQMPRFRYVGNTILTMLTKIASGYWRVGDPQMGYTAISLRALREGDIDEMYEFYGYCNDLLVRLNVNGLRVVDVPAPLNYGDEISHIKYSTYIPRVSLMLLRTFLWRLWSNRTSARGMTSLVLYLAGALGVVAGILDALRPRHDDLSDRLRAGKRSLTGVGVLGVAMVADALVNWPLNGRESLDEATLASDQPETPASDDQPQSTESSPQVDGEQLH